MPCLLVRILDPGRIRIFFLVRFGVRQDRPEGNVAIFNLGRSKLQQKQSVSLRETDRPVLENDYPQIKNKF